MAEKKLNYKKVFEEPMKIKQITQKYSLSDPISLERLGYFCLTFLLLIFLGKNIILTLDEIIPGIKWIIYIGVPWFVSGEVIKLESDGKKLHEFLIGVIEYYLTIKLPNKRLCNDESVKYIDKVVRFENVELKGNYIEWVPISDEESNNKVYDFLSKAKKILKRIILLFGKSRSFENLKRKVTIACRRNKFYRRIKRFVMKVKRIAEVIKGE